MGNKEIKEIKFGFENCEVVVVPYKCFSEFNLDLKENGDVAYFKCIVKQDYDINYGYTWSNNYKQPFDRLKERDICNIDVIYIDDTVEEHSCGCLWYDNYWDASPNYNENEHNEMITYKDLMIEIKHNSKIYTLEDLLNSEEGEFIGSDGEKYKTVEEDGEMFLFDEIASSKLFKLTFTKL